MDSMKLVEKIIWTILAVLLAVLILYDIIHFVRVYLQHPFEISIRHERPMDDRGLSFPTLMLCPKSSLNTTAVGQLIERTDVADYLQAVSGPNPLSDMNRLKLQEWSQERQQAAHRGLEDLLEQASVSEPPQPHLYAQTGYQCTGYIEACTYGPRKERAPNCCQNAEALPSIHGLCTVLKWPAQQLHQLEPGPRGALNIKFKLGDLGESTTVWIFVLPLSMQAGKNTAKWSYIPTIGVPVQPKSTYYIITLKQTKWRRLRRGRGRRRKEKKRQPKEDEDVEKASQMAANDTTPIQEKADSAEEEVKEESRQMKEAGCCYTRCLVEEVRRKCRCTPLCVHALPGMLRPVDPLIPEEQWCNFTQVDKCMLPLVEDMEMVPINNSSMKERNENEVTGGPMRECIEMKCSREEEEEVSEITSFEIGTVSSLPADDDNQMAISIYYPDLSATVYEEYLTYTMVRLLREIALSIVIHLMIFLIIYGIVHLIKCICCRPKHNQTSASPNTPGRGGGTPGTRPTSYPRGGGEPFKAPSEPSGRPSAGQGSQRAPANNEHQQMELYPAVPPQTNGHSLPPITGPGAGASQPD